MSEELASSHVLSLDEEALGRWPLPMPPADGDKEERGRVLIVAGSREMPGVAVLCATAALRAGAGKVTIATGASTAALVALALPECRVIGLRENAAGGFALDAARALDAGSRRQNAVLIGPGMEDESSVQEFVRALLPTLECTKIVLDAYAMGVVRDADSLHPNAAKYAKRDERVVEEIAEHRLLITPHAGELAHLSGTEKAVITANPHFAALTAARKWKSLVALKGAVTHIATPALRVWRHDGGSIGLGASGSGDALAGIIVGLAARGATLEQAAAWGVVLHARAGKRLESRFGPLGYMAREIAAEIPALMHELRPQNKS